MFRGLTPLLGLLILLILTAGHCKDRTEATAIRDKDTLWNLIMEMVGTELEKYHKSKEENEVQYSPKADTDYILGSTELPDYRRGQQQRVEIVPRDLRVKEKFLKNLTGPLVFSPKCSKHFHRLYHNTRDCTIPAYYRRCVRLLTRLAVSPVCTKG
ncbi:ALK and LTK ligand 2 [Protopterus annectens]|uniref:ALK and LTK ligand 2 n=1 Tax=Protopterus annectens TaxID=7888 RepID=UPI001CFA037D|nr:ALK and LTK ligand 2 [Protopterus annectens]